MQVCRGDDKCITITVYFVKTATRKKGCGSCLVQGKYCQAWVKHEFEALCCLMESLNDTGTGDPSADPDTPMMLPASSDSMNTVVDTNTTDIGLITTTKTKATTITTDVDTTTSEGETTATDVGTITTSDEETTTDTDVETPKTDVDDNSTDVKKTTHIEETMSDVETTQTNAETTTTGAETTTTGVETTMTDVETTTTDIETTNTDVKKAMTGVEKITTDVETPTTDVETATTDVETTVSNVKTSVTQTTVCVDPSLSLALSRSMSTAATEAEAATANDELVDDPAAPQVVNNTNSPRTTDGSPVDSNLHPCAVEPAPCTCVSASLCCSGRETIRALQAHFNGKIKAVSADFRSKLEDVQTQNAELLELVRKYKSTADRCQSKLHELLNRQTSDRNSSRLTVNEYAATKACAPDTPPSHDQMQQIIGKSAESQAKESLSASAQDPFPSEQWLARHRHKSSRGTTRHARKRYALSVFHTKLYTPSLSETLT